MLQEDSETSLSEPQKLILSALKSSGVSLGLTTGIILALETEEQQIVFLSWVKKYIEQHGDYPTPKLYADAMDKTLELFPK